MRALWLSLRSQLPALLEEGDRGEAGVVEVEEAEAVGPTKAQGVP
jgi:hypothetical protein